MRTIAVASCSQPPPHWAWALLLFGSRMWCHNDVEACTRFGCEWLGDPNGPGWGDVQQEGGWRQVP